MKYHGTPCLLRPHTPDHLRPSLTLSAYTPVSLRYTLHKLAQPRHSCCQTKLGSMSNFPGLCPYVLGRHLFVFFSICRIWRKRQIGDRKSTRLNSSHTVISYAVFCLTTK